MWPCNGRENCPDCSPDTALTQSSAALHIRHCAAQRQQPVMVELHSWEVGAGGGEGGTAGLLTVQLMIEIRCSDRTVANTAAAVLWL